MRVMLDSNRIEAPERTDVKWQLDLSYLECTTRKLLFRLHNYKVARTRAMRSGGASGRYIMYRCFKMLLWILFIFTVTDCFYPVFLNKTKLHPRVVLLVEEVYNQEEEEEEVGYWAHF